MQANVPNSRASSRHGGETRLCTPPFKEIKAEVVEREEKDYEKDSNSWFSCVFLGCHSRYCHGRAKPNKNRALPAKELQKIRHNMLLLA